MKKSSKPKFDNILLKRWLLKVGPVRRKILLAKITWKDHIKGPKSRKKEIQRLRDNNNNNDLMNQESKLVTSSSCNQKHNEDEKTARLRLDVADHRERNIFGIAPGTQHSKSGLKKVESKAEEKAKKHSTRSPKSKEQDLKRRKTKRWTPVKGDNSNGIMWRLIPIDLENSTKSGSTFQHLHQANKKKKKDRLYYKFLEIFGEDNVDSEDVSSIEINKTCETSKKTMNKALNIGGERSEAQKITETCRQKSPTFPNRNKKNKRENREIGNKKKLKTVDDTSKVSISSDNRISEREEETTISLKDVNTQKDDSSITNSTTSTEPCLSEKAIVNRHNPEIEESCADGSTTTSKTSETTDIEKRNESSLENQCQTGKRTEKATLDLGMTSESDHESSVSTKISLASVETNPPDRQQSVIFMFDKKRGESVEASIINSGMNEETDITLQKETRNSNISDDDASTIDFAVDSTRSQTPSLLETLLALPDRSVKTEPTDQFLPAVPPTRYFEPVSSLLCNQQSIKIDSSNWSCNSVDNDPNPTSTTDTESSNVFGFGMSCISDRLLGALDNIYLALQCRRRIREREEVTSKLAIKRNRQEELLRAKHEFESKLIIFREEVSYLFTRLDTWDRVLRFIAQGLDHRTPAGITPFSAAEVELAMIEAEVKIPISINEKEIPAAVSTPQTVSRVLCTIDLTEDNRDDDETIDLCDSSTDPPRSQNHVPVSPKIESDINTNGSWREDIKDEDIQQNFPSIAEVKTISSQQFEKIGERLDASSTGVDYPCYLCSRTSLVACGRCVKATYCSKICHKLHWERSHHATCVPLSRRKKIRM